MSRQSNSAGDGEGLMALQNRVDPFGRICVSTARGLFTGNRGIIHDPETRTLLRRRWTSKAWIICVCSFRGRHRDVMGRNGPNGAAGWTELFFLDEVTALASGHRPCFYCQREKATAFARRFGQGAKAVEMDQTLHKERWATGAQPVVVSLEEMLRLPDATMVEHEGHAFARRGDHLLPWSFHGYRAACDIRGACGVFRLITPKSTIAVLRRGYSPLWHPSAQS